MYGPRLENDEVFEPSKHVFINYNGPWHLLLPMPPLVVHLQPQDPPARSKKPLTSDGDGGLTNAITNAKKTAIDALSQAATDVKAELSKFSKDAAGKAIKTHADKAKVKINEEVKDAMAKVEKQVTTNVNKTLNKQVKTTISDHAKIVAADLEEELKAKLTTDLNNEAKTTILDHAKIVAAGLEEELKVKLNAVVVSLRVSNLFYFSKTITKLTIIYVLIRRTQ